MSDQLMKSSGSMFTLRLNDCACLLDTIHDDEGNELYNYKLTDPCSSKEHLYAYAPGKGLVEINQKTGAIVPNSNLTEAFLSLDLSDVHAVQDFISQHGSFISFPTDGKYYSLSYADLYVILSRLQLVVIVMSELNKQIPDCTLLFNALLSFNSARYCHLSATEGGEYIETCKHPFTEYWYDYDANAISLYRDPKDADLPSYVLDTVVDEHSLKDAFWGKEITFDVREKPFEFEYCLSASDIEKEPWAKAILKLRSFYACNYPFEENARLLIHFLYNIVQEDEYILSYADKGFSLSTKYKLETTDWFNGHYKEVLFHLCRVAIKEEFDAALAHVHPSYNADEMAPSWNVPNLYTALYFSLFYTDSKYEMYRPCANPGCSRMFKVSTSNSRKKYCSQMCQNAAAQARHRIKLKKQ